MDTYSAIHTRFLKLYSINISDHIKEFLSIEPDVEEGINFVPKDVRSWESALIGAGFQHDVRRQYLGFIPSVGSIAAKYTVGEGYREKGSPSLHCAVAAFMCNIHLDNYGFCHFGYGPDAGQHIADELLWCAIAVPFLGKIFGKPVVEVLKKVHLVVPNSTQFKPFTEFGVEIDILSSRSLDLQQQRRLTFDWSISLDGEQKVMLNYRWTNF